MKYFIFILIVIGFNGQAQICSESEYVKIKNKNYQHIYLNEDNFTENSITVFSVNPPQPTNWNSPHEMIKSVKRNAFSKEGYEYIEESFNHENDEVKFKDIKHFIGHMSIRLDCIGLKTIQTGMSSSGFEEILGVLFEGNGYGQLFRTSKGYLNSAAELEEEFQDRIYKVGNLQSMKVLINADQCMKLHDYFDEFRKCGIDRKYGGLDARPLKAEGAGCSAFAISFLQVLGLVKDVTEISTEDFGHQWKRDLRIPHKLLKINGKDPQVGFYGFVFKGIKSQWAKENEESRHIYFFDPEKFSNWIMEFDPSNFSNQNLKYLGSAKIGLTKQLLFQLKDN